MILASFSSVHKSYPSKVALASASGAVKDGERIALLGINGSGKTTLLEILAGKIDCESGNVEIPKSVRLGYLPQIINVSGTETLLEYTLGGMENLVRTKYRLDEIHELLTHDSQDAALLKELGELQRVFESSGGYAMESGAGEMLRGVGFNDAEFNMRATELSGGQRNRAALARTLISSPDLLLLDEPTNHLDISGLEFLESFMRSFKGGVIYVSHDRAFIRATATGIWEMIAGRITAYPGSFDDYLEAREKRLKSWEASYVAQKEFIEKTEDFIRRNIAGQKTRQAQSRRRMLAKLQRLEKPPSADDIASIRFSEAERSTRIVVQCQKAGFSYDEKPFLHDLEFEIERGDRIGLVGPNGSGKTTVIRLITGEFTPAAGRVETGKKLTIGYYDQLTENLDLNSTPIATLGEVRPELNEGQLRAYLARFLFRGDDVYRNVDSFSGGEQSRLALARLIATQPNFLILDEPTNHLDIQSREALEEALSEFNGTVLCVSHDRYFLDRFAEKIFFLDNGTIKINLGSYSDFKEKMEATLEKQKPVSAKAAVRDQAVKNREKRVNPLVIRKIESEIADIEERIVGTENLLTAAETASDWQKLSRLLNERDSLYQELEKLYLRMKELLGS